MRAVLVLSALALLLVAGTAMAITIPGADGSDGVFNPTSNVEINLASAVTGTWNQAGTGQGVYDPQKWAVVFKYSSVNIPAGVTVTFRNHPSRCPVVWLVSGDVTINGSISLDGQGNVGGALSEPGPGGFRGGSGKLGADSQMLGLGIGGGPVDAGAASYATSGITGGPTYGNEMIIPLIGGSGGAGRSHNESGGAGGGAILVATSAGITANGTIHTCGGNSIGCGSGGAIRLVCQSIAGLSSARLSAAGGRGDRSGGSGRIRIETNTNNFFGLATPDASVTTPADPVTIWPPDTAPTVKIAKVGGIDVPSDPRAGFMAPGQDVSLTAGSPTPFTVRLEATNVPADWKIEIRLVPRYGTTQVVADAAFVSGDLNASIWEATVTVPTGFSAMQARAYKP